MTACVECGFCEPVCPSRDLTLTPRQRIVLRREMVRQARARRSRRRCSTSTATTASTPAPSTAAARSPARSGSTPGALVKELRAAGHSPRAERAAERAAGRWAKVERGARRGLAAGGAVAGRWPATAPSAAPTELARRGLGRELIPELGRADAAAGPGAAERSPRRCGGRLPARLHQPDLRPRSCGRSGGRGRPARPDAPEAARPSRRQRPRCGRAHLGEGAWRSGGSHGDATAGLRRRRRGGALWPRAQLGRQPARGHGRGLASRRPAGLDPAGRRGRLLRHPMELEGLRRRPRRDRQRDRRPALALERRGQPCRS